MWIITGFSAQLIMRLENVKVNYRVNHVCWALGVLTRNTVTFFGTTLWTLKSAGTQLKGVNYHNDDRVTKKE